MHLGQSLTNEFCFDLPMFSKYPATSINSYFYKMTLINNGVVCCEAFLFGKSFQPLCSYPLDIVVNHLDC